MANIGDYIITFIAALFLWFPSIWAGNWLMVYFFVCVPVVCGFVFSMITILRGVHSG